MKKIVLYVHIALLLTAAGALSYIYFANDGKTDTLIQITFCPGNNQLSADC